VNETDYVPEPRASKIDKEEAPRPFPWQPGIQRRYSKQGSEYVNGSPSSADRHDCKTWSWLR